MLVVMIQNLANKMEPSTITLKKTTTRINICSEPWPNTTDA